MKRLLKAAVLLLVPIAFTLLLVLVLACGLDWAAGRIWPAGTKPGAKSIVFPPAFETVFTSADFTFDVRTNSLGLRERELAPTKTTAYRIAALGDSFTYGEGVQIEDTWLRKLETSLRNLGYDVETVNMGKPGAGPPDYDAIAEAGLPYVHPDLVIVAMLQGDDVAASDRSERLATRLAHDWLPNIFRILNDRRKPPVLQPASPAVPLDAAKRQELIAEFRKFQAERARAEIERMTPPQRARFDLLDPEVKEAFTSGNLNPHLLSTCIAGPRLFTDLIGFGGTWLRKCIALTARHLKHIKRASEACGASIMGLSVPLGVYTNHCAMANYRRIGYLVEDRLFTTDEPDEAIRLSCQAAGIPWFNVTQAFREHGDETDLFYRLDGHFTPKGHALFADLITPIVAKQLESLGWKKK